VVKPHALPYSSARAQLLAVEVEGRHAQLSVLAWVEERWPVLLSQSAQVEKAPLLVLLEDNLFP
jgi:hypothetical protein